MKYRHNVFLKSRLRVTYIFIHIFVKSPIRREQKNIVLQFCLFKHL